MTNDPHMTQHGRGVVSLGLVANQTTFGGASTPIEKLGVH